MTKIALLGAGGKMGVRLATNLRPSPYEVDHVEVAAAGRTRLRDELGVDAVDRDVALQGADVVILAVPDRLIGHVAHEIVGELRAGTAIMVLDAAAPYAGELPAREDVTWFCTHPCHPPLFGDEDDATVRRDYFGGVRARQAIVCALIRGPEEHYALCEDIAKVIYGPVMRSHRCTLENLAYLEPALSETIGATLALTLREATDAAVRHGVPQAAAMDFMLGHLNIELAIAFGAFPDGKFSDGALHAIERARPRIFRDGWLEDVFEPAAVRQSVKDICNPTS